MLGGGQLTFTESVKRIFLPLEPMMRTHVSRKTSNAVQSAKQFRSERIVANGDKRGLAGVVCIVAGRKANLLGMLDEIAAFVCGQKIVDYEDAPPFQHFNPC